MQTLFQPLEHDPEGSLMDCRSFRKQHLAYLDDTLSGDMMSLAQRHVLVCDGCAAHDTLVRRSLMMARSLPTIEPSSEFQERLRSRLATCRDEPKLVAPRTRVRNSRAVAAVAAGMALGTLAWSGLTSEGTSVIAMQPVIASQPALYSGNPYIRPALMQA
ncbi:MAG: hypothetical protein ABIW79_03165, partial [Gemmatimonas sp.]